MTAGSKGKQLFKFSEDRFYKKKLPIPTGRTMDALEQIENLPQCH
jgi:hypothetical protein